MSRSRQKLSIGLGTLGLGIIAAGYLVHCGSDDDGGGGPPAPQVTAVMGTVVDGTGAALAGVAVSAGTATATSDAKGMFTVSTAAGSDTIVRLSKQGFVPTQKVVDVQDGTATALKVVMLAEAPAQPLDAASGGTITSTRGAQLTAGANAFVNGAGQPVTGSVDVHLTPFDPSDATELEALPTLRADAQGGQAELESFGVVDVTVRQGGDKLKIKGGETLTVRIPVPAGATNPPATIPLWSFDEATGRWKQEGTATLNGTVYEGQISHMSMWNCDQVMETTCIQGIVKVESGTPLPGGYLTGKGVDYTGFSQATTGDDGRFCMAVRRSSKVLVTATHPEGGGQSREVQSGSAPSAVPPVCGSCQDVGEWVVKQGSFTGSDGQTIDCKETQNPLAGSCADGLWAFSECFDPSGKCTYSYSAGKIQYENGSRVDIKSTQTFEYFGPGGQKCGTGQILDATGDGATIALTLEGGATYKIMNSTDGGQVVECPDGTKVTLSSQEMEAVQACTGGNANQEGCEVEGIPGTCTDSSGCSGATPVCCDFGSGYKLCVPDGACTTGG